MIVSGWILFRMRNVWDRFVEKSKTHILCSRNLCRKSFRLWDDVEKFGTARQTTDDNIIRRTRFACRITKATDTHSEYLILPAFTSTMVTRTRLSVTLYVHCLSFWKYEFSLTPYVRILLFILFSCIYVSFLISVLYIRSLGGCWFGLNLYWQTKK